MAGIRSGFMRGTAFALACGMAAALSACGGGSSHALPLTCAQLAGMTIPAASIGLATTGAVVTAVETVAASGSGTSAIGEYCLVSGNIRPVDTTAPNIEFQLALPTVWNEKILMLGGGGFDGSIPAVSGNVSNGPANALVPLGRGYAVFASDSGHQTTSSTGADGSFSLNQEAYDNFAGNALKKTHDAALYLVRARYAIVKPLRAYFSGGSTGGREALTVVQRWPADWDGAVALYPAYDFTSLTLQQLRVSEALAVSGAYLDAAKRILVFKAAMAACDGLDGVTDGIISNVKACNASFDPSTATYDGVAVRCADGADTGDTCLSDAQITALKTYDTALVFGFTLASGETQYPGYNVWGADLGLTNTTSAYEPIITTLALGYTQPSYPLAATAPFDAQIADQFIRYTVTQDTTFDS
ncbi:MAG: tannase/feruloyl esterase family alpha/beta hydrolase, partial [Janthinobacterium lividum]